MPFADVRVWVKLINSDEPETQLDYIVDRFQSLKFEEKDKGVDQCTLVLRNTDLKLLDEAAFVKGQKLRIMWGYAGNMSAPREVVIQKVTGSDPITIKARGTMVLMDRKRKNRGWVGTHADIVISIAEEYGYEGGVLHVHRADDDQHYEWVQQNHTDGRFIAKLARLNGYVFWIDQLGLHWGPRPTDVVPTRVYVYSSDPAISDMLGVPKLEGNFSKQITRVSVLARDPITKQFVEAHGSSDETDFTSLGNVEEDGDPDNPEGERQIRITRGVTRHVGMMTESEAKRHADARYRLTADGKYKIDFEAIGDPLVGAKQIVEVLGIGDTWSGNFYLPGVVHNVTPGSFRQRIMGRKNALGKLNSKVKKALQKSINDAKAPGGIKALKKVPSYQLDSAGNRIRIYRYENPSGKAIKSEKVTDAMLASASKKDLKIWEGLQALPEGSGPV
jgi:hypothetical protein